MTITWFSSVKQACFSFCSLQARGEAAAMGAFLADAAAVGLHG